MEIPFPPPNATTATAARTASLPVLSLLITLPASFPSDAPLMSLQSSDPAALHSLAELGALVIVDSASLENYVIVNAFDRWSPMIAVARVISSVIQDITASLLEALAGGFTQQNAVAKNSSPSDEIQQQKDDAAKTTLLQTEIAQSLESKSLEELETMMNDTSVFEEHLYTRIPRVVDVLALRDEIAAVNLSMADESLAFREKVSAAKSKLTDAQTDFAQTRVNFDLACRDYEDAMMVFAPDYLLSRLRSALNDSEELSDGLVNSMLSGEVGVDEFMRRYREARKVYHARAIRVERGERDMTILYP
ncbi:hypothetical protein HDU83_007771 [Entophlyctis luteolus]|nr:hypothetical protein HDU83_007771 [Entophlyctis luteolus]